MAEPTVIVEKLGRDKLSLEAQFNESFSRLSLVEDFQQAKAVTILRIISIKAFGKRY